MADNPVSGHPFCSLSTAIPGLAESQYDLLIEGKTANSFSPTFVLDSFIRLDKWRDIDGEGIAERLIFLLRPWFRA